MISTLEDISSIKKKINIESEAGEYEKQLEHAYQDIAKKADIKGFRKGKVPRSVLQKYYQYDAHQRALTHLVDSSYRQALQKYQLVPSGEPQFSKIENKENQAVSFVVELSVLPQPEINDYKEIPIKEVSYEASAEEIANRLEYLRGISAEISPAEEAAVSKKGDLVTVTFVGKVDGVAFDGGSAKDVSVEIGKGYFLSDFEEGLIGLKAGEEKVVPVQFPENYGNTQLAGKKAEFEMNVSKIQHKKLPDLDDEFAKDIGDENLEASKNRIAEEIKKQKAINDQPRKYDDCIQYLAEKNPFEVPENLVEDELKHQYEQYKNMRLQYGQSVEDFESFRKTGYDRALLRVRSFFIIQSIAKKEKIEILESEVDQLIQNIAQQHKQNFHAVKKYYQEQNMLHYLEYQVLEKKTLDFLVDQSKVQAA